jgi:hypothetical protein
VSRRAVESAVSCDGCAVESVRLCVAVGQAEERTGVWRVHEIACKAAASEREFGLALAMPVKVDAQDLKDIIVRLRASYERCMVASQEDDRKLQYKKQACQNDACSNSRAWATYKRFRLLMDAKRTSASPSRGTGYRRGNESKQNTAHLY